jgi:hypothetical protein
MLHTASSVTFGKDTQPNRLGLLELHCSQLEQLVTTGTPLIITTGLSSPPLVLGTGPPLVHHWLPLIYHWLPLGTPLEYPWKQYGVKYLIAYPGFCSKKQQGGLLPGWNAGPSQNTSQLGYQNKVGL